MGCFEPAEGLDRGLHLHELRLDLLLLGQVLMEVLLYVLELLDLRVELLIHRLTARSWPSHTLRGCGRWTTPSPSTPSRPPLRW